MCVFLLAYFQRKVLIFHFQKRILRRQGVRDSARSLTSLVRVIFGVNMASSSVFTTSVQKKPKQLGKYCVAGGPENVSCKNNSTCAEISMHLFPKSNEKMRNVWIKFVQKHRPNWQPSAYSALCSAHFEAHCFTQRLDLGLEMGGNRTKTKRWLNKEAYPTIDTVVPVQTVEISDRERRQVILMYNSKLICD